jgi:hypothetical protein
MNERAWGVDGMIMRVKTEIFRGEKLVQISLLQAKVTHHLAWD